MKRQFVTPVTTPVCFERLDILSASGPQLSVGTGAPVTSEGGVYSPGRSGGLK